MRTDAINWFAFSELCRSLQDGGKTPLTGDRPPAHLMMLEPTARLQGSNNCQTPLATSAFYQPNHLGSLKPGTPSRNHFHA
jgi:hypothetical protein